MSDFHITPVEILCLKQLETVSQALASKLDGQAGRHQKVLADTLHDVITRYEIASAKATRP